MPNDSVFVSYSRRDADFVTPVVQLLRGTRELVFRDADSIRPGSRWRQQIEAGLRSSSLFVLFWCAHAAASPEVRGEYELALAQGKDILPVLFDDTPLPDSLGAYQWVDFRELAAVAHARRRPRRMLVGMSALVLTIALGSGLYVAQRQQASDAGAQTAGETRAGQSAASAPLSPGPEPAGSPTREPGPREEPGPASGAVRPAAPAGEPVAAPAHLWIWAAAVALTAGGLIVAAARRRRVRGSIATAGQQRMAAALQAELLRRGDRAHGHAAGGAP